MMEITEQQNWTSSETSYWVSAIIYDESTYLMKAYSSISATSHQKLPNTTITK